MCPKNDDPLTTGQTYRSIVITTGSSGAALVGSIKIHFNGQVATLNADGSANTMASCAAAFTSMKNIKGATCAIAIVDPTTKGTTYTVAFTEWSHIGAENNLLYHYGNPPLTAFTCDVSGVSSTLPTCAIADGQTTNLIGKF